MLDVRLLRVENESEAIQTRERERLKAIVNPAQHDNHLK